MPLVHSLGDMRGSQVTGVLTTCEMWCVQQGSRLMHTKSSGSQTIYSSLYKCEFYCGTFGRPSSLLVSVMSCNDYFHDFFKLKFSI
jgi:hypothetical protein